MRGWAFGVCVWLIAVGFGPAQESAPTGQLTLDEAKRHAQEKSGRLRLDGLKSLTAEIAKELARHDGWLSLNGLTSLSNEAAEALAAHKGPLYLDGLTKLSDEAAASLARVHAELSLQGVTSLSDASARALAKHTGGRLRLDGVARLSADAIRALTSARKGPTHQVHLPGLTWLSADEAAALAEAPGNRWDGRLPRLQTVSVEAARALARRQGTFAFEGLTSLADDAATALQGKLDGRVPQLTTLTRAIALALAGPVPGQSHRTLVLDGLTTLPDDLAAIVGGKDSRGGLHLSGLASLTPVAARAISRREGDLHLNGLTTISVETLGALAEHRSPPYARPVVYLKGLATLSDECAAVLASWPKWCGDLPALTTLTERSAASLASSQTWNGNLPSVATLSPEAARALTTRRGNLRLDGLTTLTAATARELASHQGGTLSLGGLKELSDEAAAEIATHRGRLSLNGLRSLSANAAASFAKHAGDWLILDGVTTLTEEIAQALARHAGIVSLKGVQKLSASSLQALNAHSRVALAAPFRKASPPVASKTDAAVVAAFLDTHCASCHRGGRTEGEFSMDRLTFADLPGRVAYASILERLRAGDMPPTAKARPHPSESAGIAGWIGAQLDAPLPGPAVPISVREKPIDGNRLPHAILFGGPRGPSVPPPPRLWRLSPAAYAKSLSGLNVSGLQQPFGLHQDPGFKDFAALYAPDEGATSLLLTNAEQIVSAQTKLHAIVNVTRNPPAKEPLWPSENRIKIATPAERKHIEKGDRVRHGSGVFAPLMHPNVNATRDELVKALNHQYLAVLSRVPSEPELASLLALYEDVARDGDCSLAGKTVLMAPLMTPEAILRFEIGLGAEPRPGVRMLSPRETALAISLALSTKRDLGLLSAAAQGKLTTREEVAVAVRNILDDPKLGKSRVLWFFREFFDYYRAPEVFKDPLPDYLQRRGVGYNARRYVADTDLFVLHVLAQDRAVLMELLTSPASYSAGEFADGSLQDGASSPIFRHVPPMISETPSRSGSDAIGIPMQPSWLVAWSVGMDNDIVRRGRWVRERLLGGRVPDLPINVQAMIPEDPHRTLRERQMVTRAAACWKCHYRMDDLGTPFEHADHYGFARATEPVVDLEATKPLKDKKAKVYRHAPIDTTGFIRHSGDPSLDGPVKDAPEMLRRLADSERVRQVFVRHAFRFFLGRNETPGDAPTLQEADRAYVASGGSFRELLVSLLSSEAFLFRTIPPKGPRP